MLTGVVIGQTDLGEADRIIRILTAERGRCAVLARGARRSKKRFAGLLEVGNRVRVTVHRGRGSLPRIDEVELVDGIRRPRVDLHRLSMLAYGCELVGRLAGEQIPTPRLTRLLIVWVEMLEGEETPGEASRQALECKALHFAGILPNLKLCARCDRVLKGSVNLPSDGGPLHAACGPGVSTTASGLARLDALLRTPLLRTVSVEPSTAGWLLSLRVQHHLRAPLKSATLLRELSDGDNPQGEQG